LSARRTVRQARVSTGRDARLQVILVGSPMIKRVAPA
jgi:hypothetical protein